MSNTENIAAVILAAGYSFPMKEFKPLIKLGNITALEHSILSFYYAGINDIRVVIGYHGLDVIEALKHYPVRMVLNARFIEGMYSSVQAGVGNLEAEIQAFFILPADIPFVMAGTLQKMLARFRSSEGGNIIYPVLNGRRGHPPLISTKFSGAILSGECPGGLQNLLRRYEHNAVNVEVADEGILLDMNNREDYLEILNYFNTTSKTRIITKRLSTR
ncbi:metal dependent phosphohydrolase [Desulfofarcimen acetoxidans DSM 771]|uniref:Metal dependent phosphohydrolase n=1 Tax=Desulfofarcimen acetoxidans (strain ATCC 49208 / DSM 771 / KCTC 5769 / VKM B-1644 / 5575) TaxID=485916 RepID=C8W6R7_DESAS|nr:nucleotidyltransferase family protein [Desulfofarcimen acetoxidans]ACV64176.1 metal dependent phosphohydrolase [Desulfofarcimen acetoxidans DSM 771]